MPDYCAENGQVSFFVPLCLAEAELPDSVSRRNMTYKDRTNKSFVVKSPSRLNWHARNRKLLRNLRYKKVEGKRVVRLCPRAHTILLLEKGFSFTE